MNFVKTGVFRKHKFYSNALRWRGIQSIFRSFNVIFVASIIVKIGYQSNSKVVNLQIVRIGL